MEYCGRASLADGDRQLSSLIVQYRLQELCKRVDEYFDEGKPTYSFRYPENAKRHNRPARRRQLSVPWARHDAMAQDMLHNSNRVSMSHVAF